MKSSPSRSTACCTPVDALMREAMQMGVQYVGGLDPTNVDGAMEKSLDAMFQIALDTGKGVDIHLHETSPAGVAAINYMIATVEQNPALRGKVTISHAFALTTLTPGELAETATRLAAQQITIASTVPIGGLMMPLPQLSERGVRDDRHRQRDRPLVAVRHRRHSGKG